MAFFTALFAGVTYNVQADILTVGAGLLDIQAALANTDLAPATLAAPYCPLWPWIGSVM